MPNKKFTIGKPPIPLTVGNCADCGDEVVLINGYGSCRRAGCGDDAIIVGDGSCRCGCPRILKNERHYKCYVTDDVLDGIGLKRKGKKRVSKKCWLCGRSGANTTIETECETPGGKHCDVKTVDVHFSCAMDME